MLSNLELARYNRHIILPELGFEGQQKLKQASVLVIGAGGLGCPVLQYLVAAGVGTIGIIDDDRVEESNLQRQILYNLDDIGSFKAEVAARKLALQNPFVNFNVYTQRLGNQNALAVFKSYDLIIDGSDNFPTRYLVNDACVILDKPLVFGSVFKFEGQVSVFNFKNGPTYRCLFPDQPEDSPNCSEIGVIGVLPGIIGSMQANEAIKIITGIGEVLSGKLMVFDALKMNFQLLQFFKNDQNLLISELGNYQELCEAPMSKIKEISIEELKIKIKAGEDIQIIDVREPHEFELFHIDAELIPLNIITQNQHKISTTKQVIIHCQRGSRSLMAIKLLQENSNASNLYNLTGGIEKWNE